MNVHRDICFVFYRRRKSKKEIPFLVFVACEHQNHWYEQSNAACVTAPSIVFDDSFAFPFFSSSSLLAFYFFFIRISLFFLCVDFGSDYGKSTFWRSLTFSLNKSSENLRKRRNEIKRSLRSLAFLVGTANFIVTRIWWFGVIFADEFRNVFVHAIYTLRLCLYAFIQRCFDSICIPSII